ncbi:MAG TPA: class I SAM-dependent methyltransferase family protein [Thermoplasmatales archaeon]|nr:class I SAM-dependent methyltransferase family protein [Thermoplasmatales archaeon]
MVRTPFDVIKERLAKTLPGAPLSLLPKKWEKIGDVLIIKLPDSLRNYEIEVAEVYASVLKCKSVLEDVAGIDGEYRIPKFRLIYGDKDTETVHTENGVRYKLDPAKIMFSSGNKDERMRMATVSNEKEVVVDMFAGIGYFSLPIAVYSRPKKIYAIEKNSFAYHYLVENISLNHVTDVIEPLLGDNRDVTPEGIADRVIMGYIKNTYEFLPVAIKALKSSGTIHYHETCPNELLPQRPINKITKIAERYGKRADIERIKRVKSYAPGVSHVVIDVRIE